MKGYVAATLTTGAMLSALSVPVILAGAATAAPTGPSVTDTVDSLQSSGYHVIVNKTGAAPLSECTVSAVRPGQAHTTADSRGGGSVNTTVISQTVYVDVTC